MDAKPSIMIMQPHLAALGARLQDEYTVLQAGNERSPAEAVDVRAVIVAGEFALDKPRLEAMAALGLIACFTSGYDGIDVAWARSRGLAVTHAPGVNHEDVADHALGLIIASRRAIVSGDRSIRAGAWTVAAKTLTPSLGGQRVGLVGLGRIGEAVARRCEAMRMPVAWWGPRLKPDAAWTRAESLMALARDSDILVVSCLADEANRGLISADVIAALGPSGLLVNVARGQLVDEPTLISALRSGQLGAAALDVFAQEPTQNDLWAGVPNMVLTPHTAGATVGSVAAMMTLLKANLSAFFAGAPLPTPAP